MLQLYTHRMNVTSAVLFEFDFGRRRDIAGVLLEHIDVFVRAGIPDEQSRISLECDDLVGTSSLTIRRRSRC